MTHGTVSSPFAKANFSFSSFIGYEDETAPDGAYDPYDPNRPPSPPHASGGAWYPPPPPGGPPPAGGAAAGFTRHPNVATTNLHDPNLHDPNLHDPNMAAGYPLDYAAGYPPPNTGERGVGGVDAHGQSREEPPPHGDQVSAAQEPEPQVSSSPTSRSVPESSRQQDSGNPGASLVP